MTFGTIATKRMTVDIQENGIIRQQDGLLIGRLVDPIEYIDLRDDWTPVAEGLPENIIEVVVQDEDGEMLIMYREYDKWFYDDSEPCYETIPVAWQPLPAPYNPEVVT